MEPCVVTSSIDVFASCIVYQHSIFAGAHAPLLQHAQLWFGLTIFSIAGGWLAFNPSSTAAQVTSKQYPRALNRAKGDEGIMTHLLTPYKGSDNIRAEAREIKLNKEPPSKLENGFGFVVLAIVWIVVFEDVDAADMFCK